MAANLNVETSFLGTEEVGRLFVTAGNSIRDRVRRALFAIGEDVADAARSAAPRKTGALQGSIKAKLREDGSSIAVTVAPGKLYARFLEFGVVNHGSLRNRSLARGKLGRVRRVRELRGLGQYRIQPHPFMGPAEAGIRSRVMGDLDAAIAAGLADAGG